MTATVAWLRRDLRLADHPALLAAAEAAGSEPVAVLFVLDPALWPAATPRRARLVASLHALDGQLRDRYAARLLVRRGRPQQVVPEVARELGARSVHVSAETTPYGRARDERVRTALEVAGCELRATGTPYAVGPGVLLTGAGTPYRVFTPYAKAWRAYGCPGPAPAPKALRDSGIDSEPLPQAGLDAPREPALPPAGEQAAWAQWRAFREGALAAYESDRDRPDLPGTSRLSAALKFGELHPRSLLADLGAGELAGSPGAQAFSTELAWREFYADVLWHRPDSAWADLRPIPGLAYDEPGEDFVAWQQGRTGFPVVDAGMRQLLATGWMHNRVRMITASFLVKDLHIWWPHGARHFLTHLVDGDLAANSHGWQWVAGTGTDAAPYFRIFNPTSQGRRFDPLGAYVRRWVPELAHLPGAAAHEPWRHPEGYAGGYPPPIVDHAQERAEALRRYGRRG